MISNLYTWIFPAAVFTAAGIFNISSSVKRKRNPVRARRNKVVWFSINISIAFCFIAVSAFFIEWSQFVWSVTYIYFFLIVLVFFYLGFLFKFIRNFVVLPFVFILFVTVILFNIFLQDWRNVPGDGLLGRYRILSNYQGEVNVELSVFDTSLVFIEGESGSLVLYFEFLEIDKIIFFLSGSYYRIAESASMPGLSNRILSFLVENRYILSGERYSVVLEDSVLLSQYSIILDADGEKIFIEN